MAKDKSIVRLREKKLKNGNRSLYLDTYKDGERVYETLHLYIVPEKTPLDKERNKATYQQAEAHRARRILEIQSNKYGNVELKLLKQKTTLASVIKDKIGSCKANTSKPYITLLHNIEAFGDVRLCNLNKAYILRFIKYLEDSNSINLSAGMYLMRLNTVINYAIRHELMTNNPCKLIDPADKPQTNPRKIAYLTMEEVKLMRAAPCKFREVKRAFLFACFCGLRFSDLRKLRYGDVANVNGQIQIELTQVKTSENVIIPLSANALKYITEDGTVDIWSKDKQELIFNLPPSDRATKAVVSWAKRAGVSKHVSFHVSRHTCATLLLTYGADLYTVSKILGHTDIKTTQIYAEVINAKRAEAVNNIPDL